MPTGNAMVHGTQVTQWYMSEVTALLELEDQMISTQMSAFLYAYDLALGALSWAF